MEAPGNVILEPEEIRQSRRLQQLPPEYGLYEKSSKKIKSERMTSEEDRKPQPVLLTPTFFREPRRPTIFKGEPGEDPTKWITDYLRVSKFNQWDETFSLANVYFFLEGTARKWFENNEDSFTSWDTFQAELKTTFGDTQLYVRRAKDTLKCRAQKSGESTQSYIQDILGLCHQIDATMPEEDKISHLMKGVAEDVYQALLTKEIKTTADFIKWCHYIEEMQQRRIGRQKFARLPNVVAIGSVDEEPDLTSLIRRIVREELQKIDTPPVEEPQMGLQSLETIIREEVARSLNPIASQNFNRTFSRSKHHVQPRYNRPETTPEQLPRKTDIWRTTDNHPVCFHCGRPGHVVRYCRDRKASFDAYRQNYRRNTPMYSNESRDAEDANRPVSRSVSPSSARGRSPIRRNRSPSPYRRFSRSPSRRNEEN